MVVNDEIVCGVHEWELRWAGQSAQDRVKRCQQPLWNLNSWIISFPGASKHVTVPPIWAECLEFAASDCDCFKRESRMVRTGRIRVRRSYQGKEAPGMACGSGICMCAGWSTCEGCTRYMRGERNLSNILRRNATVRIKSRSRHLNCVSLAVRCVTHVDFQSVLLVCMDLFHSWIILEDVSNSTSELLSYIINVIVFQNCVIKLLYHVLRILIQSRALELLYLRKLIAVCNFIRQKVSHTIGVTRVWFGLVRKMWESRPAFGRVALKRWKLGQYG